ncbi:monocarboxylate transporter 12-like [Mizuhopecten yessoensis]|uniref:monocarboxylate transporter 12-like n=1 Tax=Mizuhopecten yessoensis TaxID=6573 RepID=UPI000B458271|nr:monocarboxylate transporter 12-like [Mizuhopecten yessoensis]
MFLSTGFPFNIFILNPEFLRTFESNKAETALIQSITTGMLHIAGTFCWKAVARYGPRMTGIAGSLLVTLGLVFSFFAESIPHLIMTLGLVSGIGFSATVISAVTSVGEYFEGKSKLLALSFLTFGSGCGSTLCGVIPGLCKKYIPHTSVLIIPACFTIIGSVATALLPHAETYVQYVVLLVCLGMTLGVSVTTVSVTTVKIVRLQDYSAGLGVLMTMLGISGSISGPSAGFFVDLTGSYTKPFYGMSAGLGLAAGLFVLAAVLKRKSNNNHSDHVSDITVVVGADNPAFSI